MESVFFFYIIIYFFNSNQTYSPRSRSCVSFAPNILLRMSRTKKLIGPQTSHNIANRLGVVVALTGVALASKSKKKISKSKNHHIYLHTTMSIAWSERRVQPMRFAAFRCRAWRVVVVVRCCPIGVSDCRVVSPTRFYETIVRYIITINQSRLRFVTSQSLNDEQ